MSQNVNGNSKIITSYYVAFFWAHDSKLILESPFRALQAYYGSLEFWFYLQLYKTISSIIEF